MSDYKDPNDTDLLKEFREKETTIEQQPATLITDGEIEHFLDFRFEDFTRNVAEIKKNYDEYGNQMDSYPIRVVSTFFSINKKRFKLHHISTDRFAQIFDEHQIGSIFGALLSPTDTSMLTTMEPQKNVAEIIELIAVIASLSTSGFKNFLSDGSLFTLAFNIFTSSDYSYLEDIYSLNFFTNLLSIMINTAEFEQEMDPPFEPFQENSQQAIASFIWTFQTKVSQIIGSGFLNEYALRIIAELMESIPEVFQKDDIIGYIIPFIDTHITSRSYFYALTAACDILVENAQDDDIIQKLFAIFKSRLFQTSKDFDLQAFPNLKTFQMQTQAKEFQFITILFQQINFPTALKYIEILHLPEYIQEALENDSISQHVLQLLIEMLDISGEIRNNEGKICQISLFSTILVLFNDDITEFIDYIQSLHDGINIYAKFRTFDLLKSLLAYNTDALNYIASAYDFEGLCELLETGSKELTIPSLQFLFSCVQIVARQSPRAVEDLVNRFDECDIPTIVEELATNEDPDIESLAKRLIDAVHYYLPESED